MRLQKKKEVYIMEKLENLFNKKMGIILFYVIVAVFALMLTERVKVIDNSTQVVKQNQTFYA